MENPMVTIQTLIAVRDSLFAREVMPSQNIVLLAFSMIPSWISVDGKGTYHVAADLPVMNVWESAKHFGSRFDSTCNSIIISIFIEQEITDLLIQFCFFFNMISDFYVWLNL